MLGPAVGVPLQLAATCYPLLGMIDTHGPFLADALQYGGSLDMAAICAWLFSRMFHRFGNRRWINPILSVGRRALTNHILLSVIAHLVFYSYGRGLFGRTVTKAVGRRDGAGSDSLVPRSRATAGLQRSRVLCDTRANPNRPGGAGYVRPPQGAAATLRPRML